MTRRKKVCLILALVALLIVAALVMVFAVARNFVAQEHEVRSVWQVDVGEMLGKDETLELEICQAALESDLSVIQLVPYEVDQEGFTYYDTGVQDRLAKALDNAKQMGSGWTAEAPLAILNPFGTGSNGLYLYFETTLPTQVSYTIHVDDESIPDCTATANSGQQT